MSLTQPTLIPRPWAQNGAKDEIPDTTTVTGRASWSVGFPEENALPRKAGGIPPNWLDFQGVLNALSSHAVFEQAGGHYAWDSGIDYPVGACIIGSNNQLYKALQQSGPGTSAGAKNPTSSGNSAYWGTMATPDGQTIKIVNGKLSVDLSSLADGTTIINSNDKLSVGATATAALLADGTTITANNGKLTAVNGGGGDAASLVDNVTTIASSGKIKAIDVRTTIGGSEKSLVGNVVFTSTDQSIAGKKTFTGEVHTTALSGTAVALSNGTMNLSNGTAFTITLSGNITFSFSNVPSGFAEAFLLLVQSTPVSTITWPNSIEWSNNSQPPFSYDGATSILHFMTFDGGTNWYGERIYYSWTT